MSMKRSPEWYERNAHLTAIGPDLSQITEGRIVGDVEGIARAFESAGSPMGKLEAISNIDLLGPADVPTLRQCRDQAAALPRSPGAPRAQVAAPHSSRWELFIPGEPIAKGRPKLAMVGGHARAFTPAKTRRYEDIVRQTAIREWNRPLIAERAIWMWAQFTRAIPQSWSRKKREQALAGELHPIGRPDTDNILKSVTDAMNGVVYFDDSLIVDAHAVKCYGASPGVTVVLLW